MIDVRNDASAICEVSASHEVPAKTDHYRSYGDPAEFQSLRAPYGARLASATRRPLRAHDDAAPKTRVFGNVIAFRDS